MMVALLETLFPWIKTLPAWEQPAVITFIPCFTVLAVLMCWRRSVMHRKGITPTKTKTSWPAMAAGVALLYVVRRYGLFADFLSWPERTFPYYRAHSGPMILGFFAAAWAALFFSRLYAALFLRGSRNGGSDGGSYIGVAARRPARRYTGITTYYED